MKTETYFNSEGNDTEVTFDDLQYQFLSSDNAPYDKTYECRGTDGEGNIYSGIAEFSSNDLVEITDIEFVDPYNMKQMKALYDAEVRAGIYDPKNPNESLRDKQIKAKDIKNGTNWANLI